MQTCKAIYYPRNLFATNHSSLISFHGTSFNSTGSSSPSISAFIHWLTHAMNENPFSSTNSRPAETALHLTDHPIILSLTPKAKRPLISEFLSIPLVVYDMAMNCVLSPTIACVLTLFPLTRQHFLQGNSLLLTSLQRSECQHLVSTRNKQKSPNHGNTTLFQTMSKRDEMKKRFIIKSLRNIGQKLTCSFRTFSNFWSC